jgi:hypothetical protein
METETIDRLFLELSQFSNAKTMREIELETKLAQLTAAPLPVAELRERLAELAHAQWSGWMRYMFARMDWNIIQTGKVMHGDDVKRWERQMNTPYVDLPENEKESDRAEADKVLAMIVSAPTPAVAQVIDAALNKQRAWKRLGNCQDEFGPNDPACGEHVEWDDTAQIALNAALDALPADWREEVTR